MDGASIRKGSYPSATTSRLEKSLDLKEFIYLYTSSLCPSTSFSDNERISTT